MHDIKWIRENAAGFDGALARRGVEAQSVEILKLDAAVREAATRMQDLQSERNRLSKEIGQLKSKGDDAAAQSNMDRVSALKADLAGAEGQHSELTQTLGDALGGLPNLPSADAPDGANEDANTERVRMGEPPNFDFAAKDHVAIGEGLGLMDFEAAARMSGARFVILRGALAQLERALAAYMLDILTTGHGYTEMSVPHLVRSDAAFGTGQLPKFADDLFATTDEFWLIPTAEVPLTNTVREQILDADALPLRMTAHTPCYRSEAGSAGQDTRGMIRQHQFIKVEMVSVVHPDDANAEHDRMTGAACDILDCLELPYRVMDLATGDMGFSAKRTYDLEVWLPGQDRYREISSCSNCGDFQARRMNTRFRPGGDEKGTRFPHTLNGSGLAVGRTLVAVLENYQNADGSVTVPTVLRPYMHGMEVITSDG
ncbi:MAG: serine--tRNA ligase [Alphaproteobacteria bacterium]|jgi:seryl-tRNA synthetase|nr:serine--tRNA ligase [Alphaproteobacteria bacterium]